MMARFDWSMAHLNKKVELKCVSMGFGELFVKLAGVKQMLLYSVKDLDIMDKVG